jgi:glycosyltransferase involved in cell wall biosynthesis
VPDTDQVQYSIIVPIYKNADGITALLEALERIDLSTGEFEVVFVVDGSPDDSFDRLQSGLNDSTLKWQLVELSRNFGSFTAIRQGLNCAQGRYFAVMAADLQEPPELLVQFFELLRSDRADVVVGVRSGRDDPALTSWTSQMFWRVYRWLVMKEMPVGGVDVFGCNLLFRDALLSLKEKNSFLIGQLFWVGFRRAEIGYRRRARQTGRSAWTLWRRIDYMFDAVFAFSDLPIKLLMFIGLFGIVLALGVAASVGIAWMLGWIAVKGYAPIMLSIAFFGSLLTLGQGILGYYLWRIAEDARQRPSGFVLRHLKRGTD